MQSSDQTIEDAARLIEQRYRHMRPLFNKVDDSDPCEILSVDLNSEPAIVRLRCDNSSTLELTVHVNVDTE